MEFSTVDTAVVFIDPQVDVLSPDGKNWVSRIRSPSPTSRLSSTVENGFS